jgi:hypothetical protein
MYPKLEGNVMFTTVGPSVTENLEGLISETKQAVIVSTRENEKNTAQIFNDCSLRNFNHLRLNQYSDVANYITVKNSGERNFLD